MPFKSTNPTENTMKSSRPLHDTKITAAHQTMPPYCLLSLLRTKGLCLFMAFICHGQHKIYHFQQSMIPPVSFFAALQVRNF